VELNKQIIDLVQNRPSFSGQLYDRQNVKIHIAESRSYISRNNKTYDLLHLPVNESFGSSAAGLYALDENYLYTVEALKEYIMHLTPAGYLSISRWIKLPARDTLKLLATAIEALKQQGIEDPGKHLLLVRSWQSSTLLVKRSPVTEEEIAALKEFCRDRSFDLAYYPGMKQYEANKYNILRQPYFFDGATALLGREAKMYSDTYKFSIKPAVDDKPYFSHFFKWQTLPEILSLKGRGGMPLLESGYLILVVTLLQSLIASLFLIIFPLVFASRDEELGTGRDRYFVVVYFLSIGFGFLFLEIVSLQKFILFLGHPLYAASAVLASFLVFSGLGSLFVQNKGIHVGWPITVIVVLGFSYMIFLPHIFSLLLGASTIVKFLTAIVLIAPLAFCMGMPFPLALLKVGATAAGLIPWAWAVNGCASVFAAVLAMTLAIQFGLSFVMFLALALYGIAAVSYPKAAAIDTGT
jgi:hypothetical protein